MLKVILRSFIASLITFSAMNVAQAATVLDFETYERNGFTRLGNTLTEDGFILDTDNPNTDFVTVGTSNSQYDGSTAVMAFRVNAITNLRREDNGLFGVSSIDLLEYGHNNPVNVTFTGTFDDGQTTQQTFSLDANRNTRETFQFNSLFTNLVSLSWGQVSPYHQFDNITIADVNVSAVPLPPSVFAFGTAMLGVGFLARRRRKQKSVF